MRDLRSFGFMVVGPPGTPEPALAIAGSRAGAIGVLDLEFATDPAAALASLERLVMHGRDRLGVLLDSGNPDLLETILAARAPSIDTVVLTPSPLEPLGALVEAIHRRRCQALVIARNLTEARNGQVAGADGLIAKGHEAGGWVDDETAFVLCQRLVDRVNLPLWVLGGVGLHTVAAAYVAGAAGVVLSSQLLLARESPLSEAVRARVERLDGSEAVCCGGSLGAAFRAYLRPGMPVAEELRELEATLASSERAPAEREHTWREAVARRVDWSDPESRLLAVGQDAAFAAGLARRFRTVGGIVEAMRDALRDAIASSQVSQPLGEGSALAQSHGTRYPILQGPMTRVSDRAEFAAAVADQGALPFLALALMHAPEAKALLEETRDRLGDRPWGVGILGFVPTALRAEQLEVIREVRPPYALIAGGRPDQARALEAEGIATYLHVPSPGLLRIFLDEGARRFVFEGRECGGHVGPRTSFVLWESVVEELLERVPPASAAEYHVVFAGGIHDARSAAMVTALAHRLVERGMRIGVLLGTAYVFTEEAVQTGAIVQGFQDAALRCEQTALLESGPGHATRCAPSPFVEDFWRERRRLLQANVPADEARSRLEDLNVGRLRVASKGVDRHPRYGRDPEAPKLAPVEPADQWTRGMFMIGQVAALRDAVVPMAHLHHDVSIGSGLLLATTPVPSFGEPERPARPADVAIVGMACILPGAPNLATYWSNILNKVDTITEVPADRWDWRPFYDPDRAARDKVNSRWGGFVDAIPFDPVTFGMPPSSLPSIEPFQLLTLAVVRDALDDAGLLGRPFPRERTSVILGAGGGAGDLFAGYMVRSSLPRLFGAEAPALVDRLQGVLPEWTEDSFAGLLMNVAAGRVANRFDFGGVNYAVDAACASSLAAVYHGVRELEAGTSDVCIVGGIDAIQNPFAFLAFSKTYALSPNGRCKPFDAQADGIAISEGFVALVLKRVADAERDGDRVYAVIRGVGGSSDGRDRGLTAPRPEGQIRALSRAYRHAGYSPAGVGLIEAHGTGTVAGDQAEVQSLTRYFGQAGARTQRCAIGSVKSMIGHTKAAAGVAGLAKVALALHHRLLPPTIHVTEPNPKANFAESPFYVNTEARPWIQDGHEPRRAGVSAFGFGGTNFHVAVEEYAGEYLRDQRASLDPWPAELVVLRGRDRAELRQTVDRIMEQFAGGGRPRLADLAYTAALRVREAPATGPTLAVVASNLTDLQAKLAAARTVLDGAAERHHDTKGVHFSDAPLACDGSVAFLFPGQGSQNVDMGRDLAILYPEARAAFERADRVLADVLPQPLSRYVFPPPSFGKEEEQARQRELTDTNVAQPALGATSLAYLGVLRRLGIAADVVGGHSYGEFVALHAAGCFDEDELLRLSEVRGRYMREGAASEPGTMAAVDAGPAELREILTGLDVAVANLNAPKQTVISGTHAGVEVAVGRCAARGIRARRLPVACAFHSPLVAPAQRRLAETLARTPVARPRIPVYSNTIADVYPHDGPQDGPKVGSSVVDLLADHLIRPVEWVREIEAMYRDGARVFVEVGPRNVLTNLTGRILAEMPHVAIALDQPGRPGHVQLLHALAALAAEGRLFDGAALFRGRSVRRLDLTALDQEHDATRYSATTWLVHGGRARPALQADAVLAALPVPIAILDDNHSPRSAPERPALGSPTKGDGRGVSVAADSRPTHSPATQHPKDARSSRQPTDDQAKVGLNMQQVAAAPQPNVVLQPPPARLPVSVARRDGSEEVLLRFQDVMQRFLETQQTVMLAYLRAPQAAPAEATVGDVPAPCAASENQRGPAHPRAGDSVTHTANGVTRTATPAALARAPIPPAALTAPPPNAAENGRSNGAADKSAGTAPVVVATAHPNGSTLPTANQLRDRLLALVSERTGYPTEMLALDVDLEADLGVDSIKRVEIVGTLVRSLSLPPDRQPDMETLTSSRTLRKLLDNLSATVAGPDHEHRVPALATAAAEGDQRPFDLTPEQPRIGRYVVEVAAAPPIGTTAGLARSGVILITDDETGVAAELAASLARRDRRVVRVRLEPRFAVEPDGTVVADLGDPSGVEALVRHLRDRGQSVAALVHLAPLRTGAADVGLELERWQARLKSDLRGFFLLAQALRSDLEEAATRGGAAVLCATAMGGAFASDGGGDEFFPGHGGLAGFLKTVAQEWPTVRVKAVDVAPAAPEQIAGWLGAELEAADRVVEVGYRDGRRVVLRSAAAPLRRPGGDLPVGRDSVLLVIGGARGITAEVTIRLAEAGQPTLILVGRTPLPSGPEAPDTAELTDRAQIKQALIARHRAAGGTVAPAQVEEEYRRLCHEREVRLNLARLEQTGARVDYRVCDVRDPAAFGALVDAVYRVHGRIDGVIQGAGIIEDKLVRDKQLDSFDRVVDTKVASAVTLVRSLRPDTLKFLVFFSSIAGRLGNRGQADYGAANEILNKLSIWLGQRWDCHVVALNWGPWATLGMATPEIQRQFAQRGIAVVPVDVGCDAVLTELATGRRSDAEVIVAGGPAVYDPTRGEPTGSARSR